MKNLSPVSPQTVTQISVPMAEQGYYVCKWEVPSFSDSSKAYTVSKTVSGDYQCSCPRWTKSKLYRRQQCKHIDAVLSHLPPSPPPQNKSEELVNYVGHRLAINPDRCNLSEATVQALDKEFDMEQSNPPNKEVPEMFFAFYI